MRKPLNQGGQLVGQACYTGIKQDFFGGGHMDEVENHCFKSFNFYIFLKCLVFMPPSTCSGFILASMFMVDPCDSEDYVLCQRSNVDWP